MIPPQKFVDEAKKVLDKCWKLSQSQYKDSVFEETIAIALQTSHDEGVMEGLEEAAKVAEKETHGTKYSCPCAKQAAQAIPGLHFRDYTGSKSDEIEKSDRRYYFVDNINCYTAEELGKLVVSLIEQGIYKP